MLYLMYILAGVGAGIVVTVTAFVGTVIGSYCGYLFSKSSPDGLGYLSMITTILLGVKFLLKPMNGGADIRLYFTGDIYH